MTSVGIKRARDEGHVVPGTLTALPVRDAQPTNRGGETRPYRINLPVGKWKLLSAKGYVDILKGVERLLWCPVLVDEAYRDFDTFLDSYDGDPQEATTMHMKIVRVLDEQPKLMGLSETQEQLGIAMQQMLKLRDLTIMPSRHALLRPKPERLNVYAFASTIAAFGKQWNVHQTENQIHETRSGGSSTPISKLRIVDVDLCALLACAPLNGFYFSSLLARDNLGNAFHLPAGLADWQEISLAWYRIAHTVTTLQCEFIRSDAFMPRLAQIACLNGTTPQTLRARTTTVLAAFQQLQSLRLNFSFFSGPSHAQAFPDRACNPATGPSASINSSPRVVLPELDIGYILPHCEDHVGRRGRLNFEHLHSFMLLGVVLTDSEPLLGFIRNHPRLQTLLLRDVGYRCGPGWNEMLDAVATSLPRLRKLIVGGLSWINALTNSLELESLLLYEKLATALPERIEFVCN